MRELSIPRKAMWALLAVLSTILLGCGKAASPTSHGAQQVSNQKRQSVASQTSTNQRDSPATTDCFVGTNTMYRSADGNVYVIQDGILEKSGIPEQFAQKSLPSISDACVAKYLGQGLQVSGNHITSVDTSSTSSTAADQLVGGPTNSSCKANHQQHWANTTLSIDLVAGPYCETQWQAPNGQLYTADGGELWMAFELHISVTQTLATPLNLDPDIYLGCSYNDYNGGGAVTPQNDIAGHIGQWFTEDATGVTGWTVQNAGDSVDVYFVCPITALRVKTGISHVVIHIQDTQHSPFMDLSVIPGQVSMPAPSQVGDLQADFTSGK